MGRSPHPVGFIHFFIHESGRSGRIPSSRISSRLSRTVPTSTVVAFAPRALATGSHATGSLAPGAFALGATSAVAREIVARAAAVRSPAIPVPMAPMPTAHASVVPTPLIRRFETDSIFESISGPKRGSSDSNFERSPKGVRSPASLPAEMRHPEAWWLEILTPKGSLGRLVSRRLAPGRTPARGRGSRGCGPWGSGPGRSRTERGGPRGCGLRGSGAAGYGVGRVGLRKSAASSLVRRCCRPSPRSASRDGGRSLRSRPRGPRRSSVENLRWRARLRRSPRSRARPSRPGRDW